MERLPSIKKATSSSPIGRAFPSAKITALSSISPIPRSVALNRVIGQDPSLILGSLIANGSVFLVNPNGIVIGKDGSVQTGGFVGSTLGIKNSDFRKGNYTFKGSGGAILNQGDLKGGIVALIAPRVQNDGSITGGTALAGGTDVTLDFDGDGLIGVEVNASTLGTLVENRGVIKADGGIVFLTAKGANDALRGIVNNSGVIEASSLENRDGRILLLGDMKHGTVNAAGTLEASFVETSAARVNIADGIKVKTNGGKWLIDPNDFTIAASGGNITGATLSNNLANGNVTITTATQGTAGGNGDIFVNDGVTWSANRLTLNADRNININTAMNATGTAGLALEYAQTVATGDYYVNAPVNLASTGSFSTKKGADATINYTIISSLGAQGSTTGTDLQGISGNLSGNYVLGSNIDASSTSTWNSGAGFDPLGSDSAKFVGRLAGLGHRIDGISILRGTRVFVGLLGYVGANGLVRDVGINGGSVTGSDATGGLVGGNDGTILRSYSTALVQGREFSGGLVGYNYGTGTISESYATGDVSGRQSVGGLVGFAAGTVTKSRATGNVTGVRFVGGLVGVSGNAITQSFATGNVSGISTIGGLVGQSSSSITDSYATGTVTGSSGSSGDVSISESERNSTIGGLVGYSNGTMENVRAEGAVSGKSRVGGLVGTNESGAIVGSHAKGMVTGVDAVGGLVGLNAQQFADRSRSTIRNSYATGNVTGTGQSTGGLVGANAGSISQSYASGTVTGNNVVGGLVGSHDQLFGGSITDAYAVGNVTGTNAVGGLVGLSDGPISNAYAAGSVSGTTKVGGLVGDYNPTSTNKNLISNSFFDTQTTGQNNACGSVASGSTCSGTGLTTAQMKNAASFTAAGWDFTTVWAIDPAINNGYPYLRGNGCGSGGCSATPASSPATTSATDIDDQ